MVNTAPIFPGTVHNANTTFSPSTATTKTLFTAVTNGSVLTSVNYYQDSAAAMTLTLKTTLGGVTTTLNKWATPATADYTENLLLRIPGIDPNDPRLVLANGQTLELQVNSVANSLSASAIGGDF